MPGWFDVYEDRAVLERARRDTRRRLAVFSVVSGGVVALCALWAVLVPGHALPVAYSGLSALSLYAAWLVHRLRPVQRPLWHLALSVREVVALDVQGHRHALPWHAVERLDLTAAGLVFVGRRGDAQTELCIPSAFARFADLSHRAVEVAEALGRPVWVEGRPWQALDLDAVYPFLRSVGSPSA
jgi:hypothetical protein